MLSRRDFVINSLALAAPADASPRCVANPTLGGQLCKSFINIRDAFQETYCARHEPSAIWIACVAVVFATYCHVVRQPMIAEEAYGGFDKISLDRGFLLRHLRLATGKTTTASRFALQSRLCSTPTQTTSSIRARSSRRSPMATR
jgi:hypothetical protein